MATVEKRSSFPRMSLQRESDICQLAEFLANDRFPSRRIEPQEIAKSKGIRLIWGNYKDEFDGLLEHDCGQFFIFCNLDRLESTSSSRARFTVAHELGHYFIDEHRNALKQGLVPKHPSHCDHESSNPVEQEADHFASCLLMPSHRFRCRAKAVAPDLEGIKQLAAEFGTSLTSTAVRYAQLDLKMCVIIKWDKDGYGWKWLSPSAFANGWRKTIEQPTKIVEKSATSKVMGSPSGCVGDVQQTGSTAAHWFPFISSESTRNCLLLEQAVSLGRFGTLTLITPVDL